ncbi:hypothetical protein B0H11DRAFT_2203388 [Mycena galericulata]|nr:hypothetical protein B0H11DRAFT_2203388 [Mycena galericulata]
MRFPRLRASDGMQQRSDGRRKTNKYSKRGSSPGAQNVPVDLETPPTQASRGPARGEASTSSLVLVDDHHSTVSLALSRMPKRTFTVHQLRLETLLESALATLMLLHDAAITPVAHTTHTFEVLAALNRRISAPSTTASPHTAHISAPDVSATSPALDKDTKTTSMTYARAVSAETPRSPSPSPSDSDQSDIVIRLDCPDLPEYERAYPPLILYDIQTAIPGKLFAGVRWTRNKNLVLQIKPGTVSASYMIETYTRRIWDVLKPILRLPDNLPLPMFETGGSWHSVVFHNLPAAKHDCYALPHVQESLREGGFNHVVKAISILCDDQELERRVKNKIPISMRVSVLTEAAAQQLVDRGGHIVGGRFRATHYLAKPRTLAPRPKSVQNDE